MAAVRRHWALVTAVPVLILAILVAIFQRGLDSRKAHADAAMNSQMSVSQIPVATTNPAVSASQIATYQRLRSLRAELALDTRDLAALGVSSTTAHQIFTAVKTFAASSIDAIATADANCQSAKHALQEAVRSINVGSGDDTTLASLPTLKQNVADSAAQRANVMSPLVRQINSLLTSDQQALWEAARTNAASQRVAGATSVPGPFRYVSGLTSEQIQQLDTAARSSGGPGLLAAAPQILNSFQWSQVQATVANSQLNMHVIASLESADMPAPYPLPRVQHVTTRPASVLPQ